MSWIVLTLVCFGVLVASWMATGGAVLWLARRRGGTIVKWAAFGLLLGPFGLWLALRHVRPCPQCTRTVLNEVPVCPTCGCRIPRRDPADNPVGPLWSYRKDW
ncbi:MAG: hypothetical protein QF689_11800 [Candidatus Latescibacteria bacterium]|nr:hypothetical protein [Gemmatimonadaceae bacterium]MDP6015033.1 hypothetical protein [Candidatus Latescibacterota bacterium]MDP7449263.1 hypothetical protein [Candidatus Latescibacterota bacterium]HJP33478.1 hypothetical protein [Candidatus Latescibacterota bacterium]